MGIGNKRLRTLQTLLLPIRTGKGIWPDNDKGSTDMSLRIKNKTWNSLGPGDIPWKSPINALTSGRFFLLCLLPMSHHVHEWWEMDQCWWEALISPGGPQGSMKKQIQERPICLLARNARLSSIKMISYNKLRVSSEDREGRSSNHKVEYGLV